ncbi:HvfC/BufC N-terminal domain-containing protein [Fodinicurvata fenggangensis]|uniref:HvfC/BufC N-terminal domain-containing protein n=1 Tax=Fodinicurvata fenggangensis TaxID=1121830 RepID=UPI00047A3DD8|nr:DNA-binding domain-containing protein [Fodinicurvata fenggangensis]
MLRDFQREMAQAVLEGTDKRPLSVTGVDPAARLSVYRVTVQDSLRQTLAAAYPCLEGVLGARNFGVLARAYIRDHPPRQAVLADYGEGLARYLETYAHTAGKSALADLARLEWSCLQAAFAQDADVLDLPALQALAPKVLLSSGLPLHPATHLLWLGHDVDRYKAGERAWNEVRGETRHLAVLRKDREVAVCALGTGEAALFAALEKGLGLEAATESAFLEQPAFDLQRFLVKFLPLGAFTFPAGR